MDASGQIRYGVGTEPQFPRSAMSTCSAAGSQPRSIGMHSLHTFWLWITRSSDKAEKLEFKNQREAAEFVRRVYNESGTPNAKLRQLYQKGVEARSGSSGSESPRSPAR